MLLTIATTLPLLLLLLLLLLLHYFRLVLAMILLLLLQYYYCQWFPKISPRSATCPPTSSQDPKSMTPQGHTSIFQDVWFGTHMVTVNLQSLPRPLRNARQSRNDRWRHNWSWQRVRRYHSLVSPILLWSQYSDLIQWIQTVCQLPWTWVLTRSCVWDVWTEIRKHIDWTQSHNIIQTLLN